MMKKLFYLFAILVLTISLVSCAAKNPNPSNNNTNSPTENAIAYTKEFSYLPSYNGIKSATTYTPTNAKEPLATAKYLIQNTTDTKVFEDYETILKEDGWTITQEEKVISFSAKKDTHLANISIQISGKDVMLTVQSK